MSHGMFTVQSNMAAIEFAHYEYYQTGYNYYSVWSYCSIWSYCTFSVLLISYCAHKPCVAANCITVFFLACFVALQPPGRLNNRHLLHQLKRYGAKLPQGTVKIASIDTWQGEEKILLFAIYCYCTSPIFVYVVTSIHVLYAPNMASASYNDNACIKLHFFTRIALLAFYIKSR